MNKLIWYLMAIKEFGKDIHYSCHGPSFYGLHKMMDDMVEPIEDFVDGLKEVCLLGENQRPLTSASYLKNTIDLIPQVVFDNDLQNVESLQALIDTTLVYIESMKASKACENLIGEVAQHLQQYKGLINLYIER